MKDSNIYFIDTNIFLRTLVKENEKTFKESVGILKLIKNNKIQACTCNLVFAEVDWVLEKLYKFSKQQAIEALEGILELKNLKIFDTANFLFGLNLYKNNNAKFIDCLIAANCLFSKHNAVIISYDKDFDKLNVKRIEPNQLKIKNYKFIF